MTVDHEIFVKSKNKYATKFTEKRSYKSHTTIAHSPPRKSHKYPGNASLCFICTKIVDRNEMIGCPNCLIKAHNHCLIAKEPMRIMKLDSCPWLCTNCRKDTCFSCLKDNNQLEKLYRCITCDVGLHKECLESYNLKPLYKIQADMFVCIPCMTLAIHRVPGIEDEDLPDISLLSISSKETSDVSIKSSSSSLSMNSKYEIKNVIEWTTIDVYNYFSLCISEEVAQLILKNEINGRILLVLQRKDVILMISKLGLAMKVFKEIRAIQTQSSDYSYYWE